MLQCLRTIYVNQIFKEAESQRRKGLTYLRSHSKVWQSQDSDTASRVREIKY